MWYVQDPSSDFLRVNSKPNQTHQTLFFLAQQTLLPPEIPIHTLLRLAQSTQTRVVVGVARARAGGEVKETRLESFSPFSYLFTVTLFLSLIPGNLFFTVVLFLYNVM